MLLPTLPRFFPSNLSNTSAFYAKASIGAIAAYTATFNPIASALILAAQGAWEYANYTMEGAISIQQKRIDVYNKAFSELENKARQQGSLCTQNELLNARNIYFVHNLIEEICYSALAESIVKLNIREDKITEEQSRLILAYVKQMAHVELRKEGGYSLKGREMITTEQFDIVSRNVITIMHDRDGRLTNARYSTLTDLCIALDDHNNYVKNILFKSWLRCETIVSHTHLNMIKELTNFDKRMSEQLGFDFSHALAKKKSDYNKIFPAVREIICPESGKETAEKFVNLTEVRAKFAEQIDTLLACDPDMPLEEALRRHFKMTEGSIAALQQERQVPCEARFGLLSQGKKSIFQPPLLKPKLSVGEFINTYFPDRAISPGVSAHM